jgi:mannose-6-phosphate isomerase-like protein (cupin superfamily)
MLPVPDIFTAIINQSDDCHITEGVTLREIDFSALKIDSPFEMSCVKVLPGSMTPIDQHAVKECWIIAQGGGLLAYAGHVSRVHKHDILYFEPHHTHQITNDTSEMLVIYSIYWQDHAC